jgi:hypothetical protein
MTRSGARKLPVLLMTGVVMTGVAIAVAASASASASTGVARASAFTLGCVKPGASTSETINDYPPSANQSVTKGETVLVPSIVRGAKLDSAALPKSAELPQGLGPMTYTPDAIPGLYKRTFMQRIKLPATVAYAGGQAVGYITFVNQYNDDKSTYFGNDNSAGYIGIDLKRVIIGAKTLRVRKDSGDVRLAIVATGFRKSQTYAHIVSASGRLLRHVKLSRSASANPCGDARDQILFNGATTGTWKVIVNTSRTSRATAGGAVGTIRVTR